MSDALWWLPSLLIFGVAAVGVVGGVFALRRGARRRRQAASSELTELQRRAGSELVAADNEVQSAEDEVAFALAEFGSAAVGEYRTAVATARRRLREAFLLQQRLDDAEPDTDYQRRSWNTQIIELCQSARNALDTQARGFSRKRAVERGAPAELAALRTSVVAHQQRLVASEDLLGALSARYAPAAVLPLRAAIDRARGELAAADSGADSAAARIERTEPVAETLSSADTRLRAAARHLDGVDRAGERIRNSEQGATDAAAALRADLADARAVRDGHDDAEVAGRLNAAIELASAALATLTAVGRTPDPLAELDGLRAADDALDVAAGGARGLQRRLENARSASVGALAQARSHIGVARDFIAGRRGSVGTQARTRLAEAERQLALAEAEADPVAQLDAARRASTHAIDADALARYDAGGR